MKKSVTVWYTGAVLFLFVLWWGISASIQLPIVPSPLRVLSNLQAIFLKSIALHGFYSLWRIAAGLVLAVGVGFPLGVMMGYFPRAERLLSPLVYLTYPVPKIALLPILMLLFGVGELSKLLLIQKG